MSEVSDNAGVDKPLVASLHGIRTSLLKTGWQDELGETVNRREFNYESRAYGFLPAILFVLPWIRERRVEWFRERWERIYDAWGVAPSIVAHSFGTYVVAETMRKYPHVKFHRIVFCGSIVESPYPWKEVHERGQFTQLLNQYGGLDFWAGIVQWVVKDAGPSGRSGFDVPPQTEGIVLQEKYSGWRHGDYFHRANYERWLDFIRGNALARNKPVPPPRANLRPFLILALVALIAGLVLFVRHDHDTSPPGPTPTPTPVVSQFPAHFLLRSTIANNLHLDISGQEGGIRNGDPLVVYYWTNTDNQIWSAVPSEDKGWYYLETKNARSRQSNQCLQIRDGNASYGAGLVQGTKAGKPYQQWQIQQLPSGSYSIRSRLNMMSINIPPDAKPGTKVTMWNFHGGDNQLWEVVESPN